jgi:hypothetical protein
MILTYIPKVGYVGVGVTIGSPKRFRDAEVTINDTQTPLRNLELEGTYIHDFDAKGEEHEEWVVPVSWTKAVDQAHALKKLGLFANQNSACPLRNSRVIRATLDDRELPAGSVGRIHLRHGARCGSPKSVVEQ